MVWNVLGVTLSVLAVALTLFIEWPRLVMRFRDTSRAWASLGGLALMAGSVALILIVAVHYISRGGLQNMVIVIGWSILMLVFATLFGAIVATVRTNGLPTTFMGVMLALGLPSVGLISVLNSPSVFFPSASYVVASAGLFMLVFLAVTLRASG